MFGKKIVLFFIVLESVIGGILNSVHTPSELLQLNDQAQAVSRKTMLRFSSEFALPSVPYLGAQADMRPASQTSFNLANGVADLPFAAQPFALLQKTHHKLPNVVSSVQRNPNPTSARSTREERTPLARTQALSADSVHHSSLDPHQRTALAHAASAATAARTQALSASTRRTIHLGEKFRRANPGDGPSTALEARDARDAERQAAVQRLTLKHASLQGIKDEGKDTSTGPSEENSAAVGFHHVKLDKKIEAYHGVLAKAVMVLAFLAVGAMCAGIIGVVYCYRRDSNLVDPKDRALSEEARAKGKHFGRSTPQYGSYGNARGRR